MTDEPLDSKGTNRMMAISLAQQPGLEVVVATEPNPEYANHADFVISRLPEESGLIRELQTDYNGTKIIIGKYSTDPINSDVAFQRFYQSLFMNAPFRKERLVA